MSKSVTSTSRSKPPNRIGQIFLTRSSRDDRTLTCRCAGCRLRWPCPRGSFGPVYTTGPKSSAIITAPGEKCGLGATARTTSRVEATVSRSYTAGLHRTTIRSAAFAAATALCSTRGAVSTTARSTPCPVAAASIRARRDGCAERTIGVSESRRSPQLAAVA